jgi:hypothetical protein
MTNEKAEQEKDVTPKGAVEVNEEQLDDAAGGAILNTALAGEGKSVKIDFCKSDEPADLTISDATLTEKKI